MDQFLEPETDANRQFLDQKTDKNYQFLDKNLLNPETHAKNFLSEHVGFFLTQEC